MQMAGNRRHSAKLIAEIETTIGGFEIGMAEVDQRNEIVVTDSLHGRCHLGRRLAILAWFGGEDILKGDAHAIGPAELRQFEKRFPLAAVGIGPFGDLVGTQRAAMLDENARTDTVA